MRIIRNKLATAALNTNKTTVYLLIEIGKLRVAIYEDDLFKRWSIGLMGYKQLDRVYRKDLKRYLWHVQWAFAFPWFNNYKLEVIDEKVTGKA